MLSKVGTLHSMDWVPKADRYEKKMSEYFTLLVKKIAWYTCFSNLIHICTLYIPETSFRCKGNVMYTFI